MPRRAAGGPVACDGWRYDQVAFKASHNSYERDEKPLTAQLAWQPRQPHQAGCRGLEIDLHESANLWLWSVHHDGVYTGGADMQFAEYLHHLRRWSTANTGHDVVTITLDLKSSTRDARQFPHWFDGLIDECLGHDRIFTPAELRGDAASLVEGAHRAGWPTLGELKGRFVLCLSGDERTKAAYARSGSSRLCFADQRFRAGDALPPLDTGERVFFNVNVTESWDWAAALKWFAAQPGLVTRAYVVNDEPLWRRVRAAHANLVTTDKIRNHSWAHVGDEPFALLHRP
jgi:Phosphoinositide phospholipase C, Ca2+-dependent